MNGAGAYSSVRRDIMSHSWRVVLPAPRISRVSSTEKIRRPFPRRRLFYERPTSSVREALLMTITRIVPSAPVAWKGHGNTDSLGLACCRRVYTLGRHKPQSWYAPYLTTGLSFGSGNQRAESANRYFSTYGTEILTQYWWDSTPATPNAPSSSHGSLMGAYHRTRSLCSTCPEMPRAPHSGPSSKGSKTECFFRASTNQAW